MRLTIELTQGDPKTYTTEFKPSIVTPDRPIDGLYPDSGWLQSLPFDTAKFLLFISDKPLEDDKIAIKLPPIPFAKSTMNRACFEIQNERGRRLEVMGVDIGKDAADAAREAPLSEIDLDDLKSFAEDLKNEGMASFEALHYASTVLK